MIDAIVLAAGASSRMGEPKALCELSGMRVIERILATLERIGIVSPKLVLAQPHGRAIADFVVDSRRFSVETCWNQQPEAGMLSSIQCGLNAVSSTIDGVILWPVDVPLVKPETIEYLLSQDRRRWLVPTFQDRGGHPVWLPAMLLAEVIALPVSSSLRALRERFPPLRVPVSDEDVLLDVDTPEALKRASERLWR